MTEITLVFFFVGILVPFVIWYWYWTRKQFFRALRQVVIVLVNAYRLEYPDRDIKDLRFNISFKAKKTLKQRITDRFTFRRLPE